MEIHEIEQKILSEIAKTEKIITEYKELTKPISPDDAIGRISSMHAINNKSVIEASLRQAQTKLIYVQNVYAQFGTKEFGLCLRCRNPIPIGRILFRPDSLNCVIQY